MVKLFDCLHNEIVSSFMNTSFAYNCARRNPARAFMIRALGERALGLLIPQQLHLNNRVYKVNDFKIDLIPDEETSRLALIGILKLEFQGRTCQMLIAFNGH